MQRQSDHLRFPMAGWGDDKSMGMLIYDKSGG